VDTKSVRNSSVFVANGQKPPQNGQAIAARYQLVSARIGDNGNGTDEVFLFDTVRGRVWKYQRGGEAHREGGKADYIPESFVPVGIGTPVLATPGYGLKDSAEDAPDGH
jgi:hypothetical protein